MPVSDDMRAQLHEQLDAEHDRLTREWQAQAPALDPADPTSRENWVSRRQHFFENVQPIPGDRASRDHLAALRDAFRGERIFVIGNGPSLNRTALHLLEDEFTFGVNRIYLLFDRIAWRPTFYTTLDWRVAPDCADEINALQGMQLFFPERFRGLLRDGDDVAWYLNNNALHRSERGFSTDASLGVRGAGSVTGAAIQLAFHMGFDPIYLIGCDVTYSVPPTVVQEGPDQFGTGVKLLLTSTEDDDANHFDARYFGAGKKWHDPNVARMIEGFAQCRRGADRNHRTILNATVGGNLEEFDRVDFRSLFTQSSPVTPTPDAASLAARLMVVDDGREVVVVDVDGSPTTAVTFGASGWAVRVFGPDDATRRDLLDRVDPAWDVMIDVRHPRDDGFGPDELLDTLGDRAPDVLALRASSAPSTLHRWPLDRSRPRIIIVRDATAGDGEAGVADLEAWLRRHGYEVETLARHDGAALDLVAHASDTDLPDRVRASAELAETLDDLLTSARRAATLADAGSAASPAASDDGPGADEEKRALAARVDRLERELSAVRASATWRAGTAVVRPLARLRRIVRPGSGRG